MEHFSKYGLDDSDEEAPQTIDDKTKKLVPPRPFAKTTADLKKIFGDKVGFFNAYSLFDFLLLFFFQNFRN